MFPYIRERYILKNFRVDFPMHVAMVSIRHSKDQARVTAHQQEDAVGAGRLPGSLLRLPRCCLRDPAFAIRGIILMAFFWITNPFLMTIGTIGMVLDLIVVLYMDAQDL